MSATFTADQIVNLRELPTATTDVVVRPATSEVAASDRGAEVAVAEEVAALPATSIVNDPYTGVAAVPFDERAQAVLAKYQQVPDEWIDIRPEGLIYLSHMKARRILNEAFGFGGWAIVPIGDFRREEKGNHVILYRTFRLYVAGRFVGEVEAAGDYWTNNSAQNYADAAEACQSYALNRLSKNFGIASQCWDKAYAEQWKRKFAEQSNGKWTKKIGAGSPAAVDPTPIQTNPQHSSASQSDTDSAPTKSPLSHNDVITVTRRKPTKEGKDEWKVRGLRNAMFYDSTNQIYRFLGDSIDKAVQALEEHKALNIEWREEIDGKYRNRVVVAAAVVGGE